MKIVLCIIEKGLGELPPQQAKPARSAANLAEIEQVPFCAVTRPRLQCYAEKLDAPHEKA